jgi:hypothetical protein
VYLSLKNYDFTIIQEIDDYALRRGLSNKALMQAAQKSSIPELEMAKGLNANMVSRSFFFSVLRK